MLLFFHMIHPMLIRIILNHDIMLILNLFYKQYILFYHSNLTQVFEDF